MPRVWASSGDPTRAACSARACRRKLARRAASRAGSSRSSRNRSGADQPATDRIGHAAGRAALDAARYVDPNFRRVAHAQIVTAKCRHKGAILAERYRAYAAHHRPCPHCHRNAGAGILGVARPGIRRVRIEQARKPVEQGTIRAFARVRVVQGLGDQASLYRVDHGAPGDGVGARCQAGQVACQPVRGSDAVGVGGEQDPKRSRQCRRVLHGQGTGHAGMRIGRRQFHLDRMQPDGQRAGQPAHYGGGGIGTIVEQQHNLRPRSALLLRQGSHATANSLGLVANRYRDDHAGGKSGSGIALSGRHVPTTRRRPRGCAAALTPDHSSSSSSSGSSWCS